MERSTDALQPKDYLTVVAERETAQGHLKTCREATIALRESNHEMGARIDTLTTEAQARQESTALTAVALKNAQDVNANLNRQIESLELDIKETYRAKRSAVDMCDNMTDKMEVLQAEANTWRATAIGIGGLLVTSWLWVYFF